MLSCKSGLDHGRHHGWAKDALFNGLDQGCHDGWAMDALFAKQINVIMAGPWMLYKKAAWTMDVLIVGPWMLFSQNGLNHGCH